MEGLIFSDFPLAPSTNEAYANNKSGSGRGRYKTDVYKHFEKSCEYWRLKYRAKLIEIPVFFKDNHFLELTISFNILWKRLLCYSKKREGLSKKFDLSNRLKTTEDQLIKILSNYVDVDDHQFWKIRISKNPIGLNDKEGATILIQECCYSREVANKFFS
jgi:hypothetical protein